LGWVLSVFHMIVTRSENHGTCFGGKDPPLRQTPMPVADMYSTKLICFSFCEIHSFCASGASRCSRCRRKHTDQMVCNPYLTTSDSDGDFVAVRIAHGRYPELKSSFRTMTKP
jgi:hypothetical protein